MLEFISETVIPFFLDLYDTLGYLGVAVGVAIETFIPLIPSEIILPMAGWKVSQSAADPAVTEWLTGQPWTIVGVMVAATIGATLGSLGIYLVGAWGGRPLLDRYGRYLRIEADDLPGRGRIRDVDDAQPGAAVGHEGAIPEDRHVARGRRVDGSEQRRCRRIRDVVEEQAGAPVGDVGDPVHDVDLGGAPGRIGGAQGDEGVAWGRGRQCGQRDRDAEGPPG